MELKPQFTIVEADLIEVGQVILYDKILHISYKDKQSRVFLLPLKLDEDGKPKFNGEKRVANKKCISFGSKFTLKIDLSSLNECHNETPGVIEIYKNVPYLVIGQNVSATDMDLLGVERISLADFVSGRGHVRESDGVFSRWSFFMDEDGPPFFSAK